MGDESPNAHKSKYMIGFVPSAQQLTLQSSKVQNCQHWGHTQGLARSLQTWTVPLVIFRLLIHFFTFDTVVLSKLSISFVPKKEKYILKRELFFPSISSQLEGTIIWTISLHQPSRSITKRISYWLNCYLLGYGARLPICKRSVWPTKTKVSTTKKSEG